MTAQPQPKYAAKVPEAIQTPDVVETSRLGRLDFFDGMPAMATGITPAMAHSGVGKGSAYAFTPHDAQFWSFVVYSGRHRSLLETDQKRAGVDSQSPDLLANPDGTYTVWFAPTASAGKEGNWVQTMPGKSWSALLRLYGPLEPWFDKSWKPGDFELVNR